MHPATSAPTLSDGIFTTMTLRRSRSLGLGFALAVPLLRGQAQSRPSFEGTWTLVGAAADAQQVTIAERGDVAFRVGDMGSGWGSALTLTQRTDRLVLEYPFFSAYDGMAPLHYEFALDGRETVNEVTIGPGVTRLRSRAEWRGDTLRITTQQPVPREVAAAGVMAEVRRELVLSAPDSLRIVTTRVGVQGAPTNVVRSTYTRKR